MKKLLLISLILAVPLVILFWSSISRPEMIVFSNDGPFGAVVAEQSRAPEAFFGIWAANNWLGEQAPPVGPTPSWAIRVLSQWRGTVWLFALGALAAGAIVILKPACKTTGLVVAACCLVLAAAIVAGVVFWSHATVLMVALQCASIALLAALIFANFIGEGL